MVKIILDNVHSGMVKGNRIFEIPHTPGLWALVPSGIMLIVKRSRQTDELDTGHG